MFKRIDHIAFSVKDREKSLQFYETLLGFEKYHEHDVPFPTVDKIMYLQLENTVLELIHMPKASSGQGFHFCLETDNFDEDYNRLLIAGVPVDTEPHLAGARIQGEESWQRAVFIGPDGELIEIRG